MTKHTPRALMADWPPRMARRSVARYRARMPIPRATHTILVTGRDHDRSPDFGPPGPMLDRACRKLAAAGVTDKPSEVSKSNGDIESPPSSPLIVTTIWAMPGS